MPDLPHQSKVSNTASTRMYAGNQGQNALGLLAATDVHPDGDAAIMAELNASVKDDLRLYAEDIEASRAHAAMLCSSGIISQTDVAAIDKGLIQIKEEIASGDIDLDPRLEDIHMNVEARLHDLIGATAGKLHTARSRNDQVATDVRLWLRKSCDQLDVALQAVVAILCKRGLEHVETLMPGYTHLQVAQPISFGFHLGAYAESLCRDRHRLAGCRWRLNASPLGAAALAGTSHPIDRFMTARSLGFNRVAGNAMDAVSARDHIQEYCAVLTIIATNMSRLAEDMILWSNPGFGFARLANEYSSHSSIMPQKRNPDAAELIRGRSGRPLGAFVAVTQLVKALPQAYNKDLQEDKGAILSSGDSVLLCLQALRGCLAGLQVNKAAMRRALEKGYPTATDLADWMVEKGIPFREAYRGVRALVVMAEGRDCGLSDLADDDLVALHPDLPAAAPQVLDALGAMQRRSSYGGTAAINVHSRLECLQKWADLNRDAFISAYNSETLIDKNDEKTTF